jgi:hypothetical protein
VIVLNAPLPSAGAVVDIKTQVLDDPVELGPILGNQAHPFDHRRAPTIAPFVQEGVIEGKLVPLG